MSLDTLANVKTRLGISGSSDDTLLGLLMDSADAWVANYTGRDFVGGTFTEYHDGGFKCLLLTNFPVTGVTSVKVDPAGLFGAETLVAATSYAVQSDRGAVRSKAGHFDRRAPLAVQVVYTTATNSVPNDVKEAYALIVGYWYVHLKTQVAANFQNLGRQKFGDVTVDYDLGPPTPPPEVRRLLAPYRTPVL